MAPPNRSKCSRDRNSFPAIDSESSTAIKSPPPIGDSKSCANKTPLHCPALPWWSSNPLGISSPLPSSVETDTPKNGVCFPNASSWSSPAICGWKTGISVAGTFCTILFLVGAHLLVRQHASSVRWVATGDLVFRGVTETGEVWEQSGYVEDVDTLTQYRYVGSNCV